MDGYLACATTELSSLSAYSYSTPALSSVTCSLTTSARPNLETMKVGQNHVARDKNNGNRRETNVCVVIVWPAHKTTLSLSLFFVSCLSSVLALGAHSRNFAGLAIF